MAGGVSYAGGLPLEAVRAEYRAAFPQLIRAAIADRMKELAAARASVRPIEAGEYAIAGATLIDGTGAPPVMQELSGAADNVPFHGPSARPGPATALSNWYVRRASLPSSLHVPG